MAAPLVVPGYGYVRPLSGDGRVQLARRASDGAEVAVRLYPRLLETDRDRQRFEHEVTGLKALVDVPHILPVLDAGVSPDGQAYLVAPYCVAGSLWDHIASVGRFTAAEVRTIGAKLADALGTMHSREVVHRNIKPSTVLIDAAGEPVLAGFGLVAVSVSAGNFMPDAEPSPFRAPEAYLPELMTEGSDVFALGATLYAVLAGKVPEAPLFGELLPDLPRVPWPITEVLRHATRLDPRERYPRAATLRTALLSV